MNNLYLNLKMMGFGLFLVLASFIALNVYTYTRTGDGARVSAAVPATLNFQARLLQANGSIVADGNYSVEFKLYTASAGGTSVWTETQATIQVKSGYLSVYLGDVNNTLGTVDWSQQHWLTMNVNSDGEMTPRLRLTSVPYAFRSSQSDSLTNGAGTLAASDLVQLAPDTPQVVNTALAALRINQTGAGLLAQLQGNGSDVFTIAKTGDVTSSGSATFNGGTISLGTAAQSGGLVVHDGSANTGTIQTAALGSNRTYLLPDADGTICLTTTCAGGGAANGFVQDGNSFSELATLGTNDSFGLVLETSGLERLRIGANGNVNIGGDSTPDALFTVGSISQFQVNASGGIVAVGLNNSNGGITNTGSITGVGANITATAGLTVASGGSSDLVLNSASGILVIDGSDSTIRRTAAGALTVDLNDGANTTLSLNNSGLGDANLNLSDGGLFINGVEVLSNSRVLQNVTADTSILTSGLLSTARGGTGVNASTAGSGQLLIGNGSGYVLSTLTAGSGVSIVNSPGAIAISSILGTSIDNSEIEANAVALGAQTTGDYVASLGALAGLTVTGNSGEGSTPALSVTYGAVANTAVQGNTQLTISAGTGLTGGSTVTLGAGGTSTLNVAYGTTAGTAVQGNTTLICPTGTGNLSGGGNTITLGGGGTCNALSTNSAVNFATSVTTPLVANNGALTISTTGLNDLTFSSGSGVVQLDATTVRTTSGLIYDLSNASDVAFTLSNSGTGIANLNLSDGALQTGGITRLTNGGALQNITGDNTNGVSFNANTITSGLLSTARGGTGVNASTAANGQLLIGNGSGFSLATLANNGGLTITNSVGGIALEVNYGSTANTAVQGNTQITITAGTGLTGGGTITLGSGGTSTLNVAYGSSSSSAVRGDTTLSCPSGSGNLTGGGTSIILGSGGTCGGLSTINNPSFTTSVTSPLFTNNGALTLSTTGAGNNLTISSGSGLVSLGAATVQTSGGLTFDLNNASATTFTINNPGAGVANLNLVSGGLQTAGALRLTNAGALQNITTLGLSGAISGATSTNTINGLVISSGALSSITGITFTSGSLNLNSGGITNTGSIAGATTVNASGLVTSVGLTAGSGLIQGTGGLTITGTTNINASGATAVNIGNTSTPLTITSTGLNATSAGAVSGVTTLGLSGAITGATSTNTINGLIINSGALSGITDLTMSGALTVSPGGSIIANGNTGSTIATCSAGQYIGNGVRVDDGIITAGSCRTDGIGISDIRVKKDITSVGSVLDKLGNLNVVTFNFKVEEMPELNLDHGLQYGIIAQELQQIFPELVTKRADGYNEVNFQGLSMYNLKAVSELAKSLDSKGNADLETVKSGGVLRLTASGALQNINGLTLAGGGATIRGGLNNQGGGLTNTGAVMGATTIEAKSLTLEANSTGNLLTLKKDNNGVFTVFNNGALELTLDSKNAFTIQDSQSNDVFRVNSEDGLVYIGGNVEQAKTVLFVLSGRESPDDPAGVNGAQYYNNAIDRFRCYQGNRWIDCTPSAVTEYVIAPSTLSWAVVEDQTEVPGSPRTWIDMMSVREVRLQLRVNQPASEGAVCHVEYALDESSEWSMLGEDVALAIDEVGTIRSNWVALPDEAREEVIVRVVCGTGDGVAQTEINIIRMQVR